MHQLKEKHYNKHKNIKHHRKNTIYHIS